MSKQANKTVIGGFVVGAVVLFIIAVFALGGGKLFAEEKTFVMFFQGSIKGLDIGAPVMFRGVKLGSVSDIQIKMVSDKLDFWIPVYVEIETDRITQLRKGTLMQAKTVKEQQSCLDKFIKIGLRAQLQLQSVVTGKLFVGLDFVPDSPIDLKGFEPDVPEIPTIPTTFQEIADTAERIIDEIRQLPFDDILVTATDLFQSIDKLVSSPEARKSIRNLNRSFEEIQKLVRNVDNQVQPLASDIKETLISVDNVLAQTKQTMYATQELVSERSPLRQELMVTLESLSSASRSLRVLADYLERHPEALLKGKQ